MAAGAAVFIYIWYALKRTKALQKNISSDLTAERSFAVSRFVVNKSYREKLTIRWTGSQYIAMAVCREEQLSGIRYTGNTQHLISLSPQTDICLENEIAFNTIGRFSLGAVLLCVSSDWGVTEVYCPVKTDCHVLIHPELYPSLSQGVQNSMVRSFSSGIHRYRKPGDGSELYEIRNYVPGDPFKKILWSATAKTGKLIVRENETDVNIPIMFFLNTSWYLRFGSPKMMFDQLSETALGIADSAANAGDPFGFCLYGDDGQNGSNCFVLPESKSNKLSAMLHSLLNIRVQQTPPGQIDIPEMEKTVKKYLLAISGNGNYGKNNCNISNLLKKKTGGYTSTQDHDGYAHLLNQFAEEYSLPVPVLHSRFKKSDSIEKELELQEVNRLKNMLLKILPQIKGHAVFIVSVRPYENTETLLALSRILHSIPAFHHTLIVLFPDYASFAGIGQTAESTLQEDFDAVLSMPYSAEGLIRLDYNSRREVFKRAVKKFGGSFYNIDSMQNEMSILSAINQLRTIQGRIHHA